MKSLKTVTLEKEYYKNYMINSVRFMKQFNVPPVNEKLVLLPKFLDAEV